VTVNDLRAYLLRTGWRPKPFKDPRVHYFEGPRADDGTPLVQLVPASASYRDFPRRVAEIVGALSTIEQRPVEDILRNIVTPTADVLHLRVESAETRTGTLELGFAEQFFASMRNLLVFAACGELRPQPFYPRALKQAVAFADHCRLRPAPAGSFRVDVETSIVPPANEAQVQLRAYPLERLILLSLMRGLGALQQAIEAGQPGEALKQPARAVNANVCEAILGMKPGTAEVRWEARVSWCPAWPLDDEPPPSVVVFEGQAFEQIDSIGRALRTGNERPRRQLRGRVVRLSAEDPVHGDAGPLLVTLDVESVNAPRHVEIALGPEQYRQACAAHLGGHRVAIKGTLARAGRRWQLVDVTDFQVLSEAAA
jgi:hypothetical protein